MSTAFSFASPSGVLYVADSGNNRIVKGVPGADPVLTESEKWRQQYFGSPANAGEGADDVAPQNDEVVNLMKFATGMNPTQPGRMPGVLTRNGSVLEFVYSRAKAAVIDGMAFTVEWSDTLAGGSWSTTGVVETVPGEDTATQQILVTLPAGNNGKRYVRLRVARP